MRDFLLLIVIVCFLFFKIYRNKNKSKNDVISNENTIELAVIAIETAANFVNENKSLLKCNYVTMWQYGKVGEGFIIEFYGIDIFSGNAIDALLTDIYGSWKIWTDIKDEILHIRNTVPYSYDGSWDSFNRAVWDEVERKHPDWEVERKHSDKCVLYV